MKDTVLLEEMSWPAVQAALDAGVRTIVIVAGSIEQHGPHLPTMTDTAIDPLAVVMSPRMPIRARWRSHRRWDARRTP